MSRVGKQIIQLPAGVQISDTAGLLMVKGPKGQLQHQLPTCVHLHVEDGKTWVSIDDENNYQQNVLWGTNASLVKNMVTGVTTGFSKQLEINGVGFKVALSGNKLTLNVGFSHPVVFELPKGIEASVEKNVITISGIDKQQVGQVAAQIRGIKKPEPYKGKGIKYVDEVIRRKAGKAAASE